LRSYWKARGLCIQCVDKWHPGHKCNLQLHVLKEIFDLCHEDCQETDSTCEQLTKEEGHLNLLLSVAASTGQPSSHTLQFLGTMGGLTVHILIRARYRANRSFFRAFLEIGIILFIIISCNV
jgi:hypothetical protein